MDTSSRNETDRNHYPPVTGIGRNEHIGMVREIFTTIPGRYDFLNRVLSLRRDVAWRRTAARLMRLPPGGLLLDAATGTGDLGIEALRLHPGARAIGLDFTEEMLVAARAKTGAERGKVLELVVSHCDPTVNLFDFFYVIRDGIVRDIWPIDMRGKGQ